MGDTMDNLLLHEACAMLVKSRDNLLLKDSQRLKTGEKTAFLKRVYGNPKKDTPPTP